MSNPDPAPSSRLSKDAWLARYQQRFIDVAEVSKDFAQQCALCESFEVLSDGYEDDPEGAADEAMSYWSED